MKSFIKSKGSLVIFGLIIFLLIYFPLFLNLDTLPIRVWDEARQALSAIEMSRNNNYLVTHFAGVPEMWSTKPPLLIWFQVFFIKLIGNSELSIRLPSALAGLFTVLTLIWFSWRYFQQIWYGLIASFVLITSAGYIHSHVTRTGDYDTLMVLFTTLYPLVFFLYLEKPNTKYLYLFFMYLTLAVLAKSIQGLMLLPGLFIYILYSRKFGFLRVKHFWFGLILFLVSVASFYLLREAYNPGYLNAVWENELGGRYMEVNEGHKGDFLFYYNILADHHFSYWYWFVPWGLVFGFFANDKKFPKLTFFLFSLAFFYWLILSSSKTKIEWYEAPLFPYLALIVALALTLIFQWLKNSASIKTYLRYNVLPFLFLFIVFLTPYVAIFKTVFDSQEYAWDKEFYALSRLLQNAVKKRTDVKINNHFICHEGYSAHLEYYTTILNQRGENIRFKNKGEYKKEDIVIASQTNIQEYLESTYLTIQIGSFENIKIYRIKGNKSG